MTDINSYLIKLNSLIKDDNNEEILNLSEEILLRDPQNKQVRLTKMTALMKIGRIQEVKKFDKEINLLKENKLLNCYYYYKIEDYHKSFDLLGHINNNESKLIKGQILSQQEKYYESCNLYLEIIEENIFEDYEEELYINFIYSLNMFFIINEDKIDKFITNRKMINFVSELIEKIENGNYDDYSIEIFLNLSILMVIIDRIKLGLNKLVLKNNTCLILTEKYINVMMNKLREKSDSDNNLLSDEITSTILKTILQEKRKLIEWNDDDITKIDNYLETLECNEKNMLNRVSIILYISFIKLLKNNELLNGVLKKIETEIFYIKKSLSHSVSIKMKNYLIEILNYSSAIILLNQKKYKEAQKIIVNNKIISFNDNLVNFYLKIKTKNYKDLENKSVESNDEYQLVENYLLKLACYQSVNDQKKYIDIFKQFIVKFFMKQLNLKEEERFLNKEAFSQFSSSIAGHIFMNSNLFMNLKELIISFVDYFNDYELLKKIAENFISNKDNKTAEAMYKKLYEKYPENEEIKFRLNYLYSLYNPLLVDESSLPIVELIEDIDKLRSLENDYLLYKTKKNEKNEKEEQIDKKIKKKRIRKIKWPKNFDFNKPGPRPDPERWLPKYERKKYRKMALKKGLLTKNQGATLQVDNETKQNFKVGPSTANINTSSGNTKKGKKNKKK